MITEKRKNAASVVLAVAVLLGATVYLLLPVLLPKADASLALPRVSASDVSAVDSPDAPGSPRAAGNPLIAASADTQAGDVVADSQATAGPKIPEPARDEDSGAERIEKPTRISIDAIGVDAHIVPVGIDPNNRSLVVPSNGSTVGWWNGGASTDPTVLVGHVDSKKSAAVFFRLAELKAGDVVTLTDSKRADERFAVRSIVRVEKNDFPTVAVYKGDRGLRIITCGGRFDRKTRHYEDNVIVFADPISD